MYAWKGFRQWVYNNVEDLSEEDVNIIANCIFGFYEDCKEKLNH